MLSIHRGARLATALALALIAAAPAALRAQQAPAPAAADQVGVPPGSSIGLVPPRGFVPSSSFSGFVDPATQSSFLFVELPREAYEQMATGLNAQGLATRQITMRSREEVRFGGVPGVLIGGDQMAGGVSVRKWLLLFQAEGYAGIINVSLPPGAESHDDAAIRTALASLSAGPRLTLEQQREALPYTFRETAVLKLRLVAGGGAAVLAFPEQDKRLLVIARALADQTIPDRRAFAQQVIRQSRAAQNIEVAETKEATLAGCPGFETTGGGTARDGSKVTIVNWIGFCPGGYVRVEGISTPAEFDKDVVDFERVRDSLALRR